jgi:dTDP-4-amino-4,6-dideoxygalactose transaminase
VIGKVAYFSLGDAWALVNWALKFEVSTLEREFADYVGTEYALGTSFGRTALYAGLKAADVKGREVIVPGFTCTVVRHAIVMAGAIPRFVDIDLSTLEIDLEDLKRKITSKTKAVIFIHYFGRVGRRLEGAMEIVRKRGLFFIEDCAHSLGAEYQGKKIGSFGDFSIFSLTKNTINCGGGVLVTKDLGLYERARKIIESEKVLGARRFVDIPLILAYGLEQGIDKVILDRVKGGTVKWCLTKIPRLVLLLRKLVLGSLKWPFEIVSDQKGDRRRRNNESDKGNMRYSEGIQMEPIIASLGRSQLRKLDYLNERRRVVYQELGELIQNHFGSSSNFKGKDVNTHLVLRFKDRDIARVIEKCRKEGLSLKPTWPTHQSLWIEQDTDAVRSIAREIATYCINPNLTPSEIRVLCKVVARC